jgi:hypothetical protein
MTVLRDELRVNDAGRNKKQNQRRAIQKFERQ